MNRLSRIQRASVFGKVYTHLQEDFKCRKGQDSWQRSEVIIFLVMAAYHQLWSIPHSFELTS
jgi:hypothetical protein